MKVLVTGAMGQLGTDTMRVLQARGDEAIGIDREQVDFADPSQVADAVASYSADWVINCAAYTQVDNAEAEAELAFRINRDSARSVAAGVKICGGKLLHVSTDFIFNGAQSHPYLEEDLAGPLGVYGASKWEGERAVRDVLPDALVMRTAWVYGAHGQNFVKTMLRLAEQREELRVVDDQVGTPSWTRDIVDAMLALIDDRASGVFHFTNEGVASWYDFADAIISMAKNLGFPVKARRVLPIPTRDFPLPATRPAYSVLSKGKIRARLEYDIPHWRNSLENMLIELKAL